MRILPLMMAGGLCGFAAIAQAQQPAAAPDNPQPVVAADANSQAAAADVNHADILINQPFVSKSMGSLTLPFMWQASEDAAIKRVVVTEPRTETPAVLTIDIISIPPKVESDALAQSIANAIAGDLGTTAEIKAETLNIDCGKSKCPTMTVYRTQFSGKENLVDRNCALELAPSNKKMIVLSICAHGERTYAPDLAEILNQVFSMGTWKL